MARSMFIVPIQVEYLGWLPVDELCTRCLLPSMADVTIATTFGLYSTTLTTYRCCVTEGCDGNV